MKTKTLLAMIAVGVCLASCGSTSTTKLYSWHGYEDAAYKYAKKATDEARVNLLGEYAKMVENQTATRATVPPGLLAEYGYLLISTGKRDEGLKMMKEEVALYPESETYVGRIIKQLEK
ncbi:MAG: DUF4810 domain-containing protein [Bacteroidaceae bacterium]|nr:DUF4810 domain-containing protein [Bacteroidaceae bacterium]